LRSSASVDELLDVRRQRPVRQLLPESVELLPARQVAVQQEVCDLLVRGVLGEVGDVVAAVHENALVRVDGRDRRLRDDDP